MTQDKIDKVNELSQLKQSFLRFLKQESLSIAKPAHSEFLNKVIYYTVRDEIFAQRVNDLAVQRLQEIEKELEEL